jgi:hypothetical protein
MLSKEAQQLSKLLIANGLTISVAESCTGGSLSRALTSIPPVQDSATEIVKPLAINSFDNCCASFDNIRSYLPVQCEQFHKHFLTGYRLR